MPRGRLPASHGHHTGSRRYLTYRAAGLGLAATLGGARYVAARCPEAACPPRTAGSLTLGRSYHTGALAAILPIERLSHRPSAQCLGLAATLGGARYVAARCPEAVCPPSASQFLSVLKRR